MARRNNPKPTNDFGLNFEAQLWADADKLRGHMDDSEYKRTGLAIHSIGANLSANSHDKNFDSPRRLLLQ